MNNTKQGKKVLKQEKTVWYNVYNLFIPVQGRKGEQEISKK